MVTGILRTFLWVLGSLAALWLLLGLISLVAMSATGGMMQGPGTGRLMRRAPSIHETHPDLVQVLEQVGRVRVDSIGARAFELILAVSA